MNNDYIILRYIFLYTVYYSTGKRQRAQQWLADSISTFTRGSSLGLNGFYRNPFIYTLEAAFRGAPFVVGEIDEGAKSDVNEPIDDGTDGFFALGGGGERMASEELVAELQSGDESGQEGRIAEGNEIFDVVLILVGHAV